MSDAATPSPVQLTKQEIRDLKSRAQRLDAILKLGKAGVSDAFLKSLDQALTDHELVKVRLSDFKDQRKELAPQLAAKTGSQLITLLGHVVVLFRRKPATAS